MNKETKYKGVRSINCWIREGQYMKKTHKYAINPSIRYYDRGSYNKSMYGCARLKIR